MDKGQLKKTTDNLEERRERLLRLYHELSAELDALEREGHILREKIQQAIDKQKLKEVLEGIVKVHE